MVAVWLDEENGKLQWYLGIVSDAQASSPDSYVVVNYLNCSPQKDHRSWLFPESPNLLETPYDRIIASGFKVQYECISVIKCLLSKNDIQSIIKTFDEYVSRQ